MDSVGSTLGGKTTWWMVLWTASIFYVSGADVGINIVAIPPNPMESSDVILVPPLPRHGTVFCKWFRGTSPGTMKEIGTRYLRPKEGTSQGPQYTGREDIFENCTLSIKGLTRQDSAIYEVIEGAPGVNMAGKVSISVAAAAR